MASEWDKFVAPPEPRPGAGAPAGGDAAPEIAVPDLVVTLEVLLDVKDIARLDMVELRQLTRALAGVDRHASIASWPRAEPAAVTAWRLGVVRRAPRSDVAGAILHALEPYHALLRRADATLPAAALRLGAGRVATIRQNAIMMAWLERVRQIVARDAAEDGAWLEYWRAVSSPAGTREHTIAWQGGVRQRAEASSEVADRVLDSIEQRDQAMAAIAAIPFDTIVLRVPGVGEPALD